MALGIQKLIGGIHRHTQYRQHGDLISILLFFEYQKNMPKLYFWHNIFSMNLLSVLDLGKDEIAVYVFCACDTRNGKYLPLRSSVRISELR
jgi:hypothetical protein